MGQKTIMGKYTVAKDDYQTLTALAKEGITSRGEIRNLKDSVSYYQRQYWSASSAVKRLQEKYDRLKKMPAVLAGNGAFSSACQGLC